MPLRSARSTERALAAAALAVALGACRTPPRPEGEPRVTVVGRVAFDPQAGPQAMWLSCRGSASVDFGTEPGGGPQFETPADVGKLFTLEVPPGPLYLEWVTVEVADVPTTGGTILSPPPRCKATTCQVRRRLEVPANAGFVYVGALTCLPDGASGGLFQAQDDHESARAELLELGHGTMPAVVLPEP